MCHLLHYPWSWNEKNRSIGEKRGECKRINYSKNEECFSQGEIGADYTLDCTVGDISLSLAGSFTSQKNSWYVRVKIIQVKVVFFEQIKNVLSV